VRKTTPDGTVTTIAGRADVAGTTDSAAGVPLFNEPRSVAAGRDGSIWVTQATGLRRILNGTVTTVDRTMEAISIVVEADGNAVVTTSGLVQRVTPAGAKTELVNKSRVEALLKTPVARFAPQSVVADAAGNLYISDTGTVAVYKLTKAGELSIFAGTPLKETGDIDGAAGTATLGFYEVEYMTIDEAGNLYLSGQGGVRKISPTGVVSSPAFDWGTASIGALAYAKGRLYGMTRYAILQSDTK
jgi:streptogramin lyase